MNLQNSVYGPLGWLKIYHTIYHPRGVWVPGRARDIWVTNNDIVLTTRNDKDTVEYLELHPHYQTRRPCSDDPNLVEIVFNFPARKIQKIQAEKAKHTKIGGRLDDSTIGGNMYSLFHRGPCMNVTLLRWMDICHTTFNPCGRWTPGRYRSIYLKGNSIVLYTRNGGGNRDHLGHHMTRLAHHPHYQRDYDCDDGTYAKVKFIVPSEHVEEVQRLMSTND